LSIGCGDGIFDAIILQAMISKYPDIKLDYTGIDTERYLPKGKRGIRCIDEDE
jgi:hypothetical protein